MASRDDIVAYVRTTLGCQCPDAVFADLEWEDRAHPGRLFEAFRSVSPDVTTWLLDRVIRVSDRLLVAVSGRVTIPAEAFQMVEAGHKVRDLLELNRVRVAMAGFAPPANADAVLLQGRDDRVHVHWLP